jgi:hypothetical protein
MLVAVSHVSPQHCALLRFVMRHYDVSVTARARHRIILDSLIAITIKILAATMINYR